MTSHPLRDLLPLHALGALVGDEADAVERAVAADPALRAELDAFRDAAAAAVPVAPSAAGSVATVRDRLNASLDELVRPNRWERFAARVAEMFDVSVDKARMFLSWIDEPARWERWGPEAQVEVIHLPGGPRYATADCGFGRIPAGTHFPRHAHRGEEATLVLQGLVHDSTGVKLGPGDELLLPAGAEHDYVIDEASGEYIFAVRFHGIDFVARAPVLE